MTRHAYRATDLTLGRVAICRHFANLKKVKLRRNNQDDKMTQKKHCQEKVIDIPFHWTRAFVASCHLLALMKVNI
jgi:hypothetical protein